MNESVTSNLLSMDIQEWEKYIRSLRFAEKKQSIYIEGELIPFEFTFEDLNMKKYPIKCGNILKHKQLGGRFIIYDYPLLDSRRDTSYISELDYKFLVIRTGELYYVDGILNNGQEAGYTRSLPAFFMNDSDCNWRNFDVIGHVNQLDKNDPLYKVHQHCIEWYPGYLDRINSDL